jgi:L-threonylcarbamoyladenylate synthase
MRISIAQAQEKLLVDEVVAIPTETVYGLAAKLDRPEAIRKIFELKRRSLKNPLIIHVSDVSDVLSYALNLPPHLNYLN